MHKVNLVGVELEGFFKDGDSLNGDFRGDGSVSVSGNDCEGNCECFNDCDCESCQVCSNCEDYPSDCNCDGCLTCNDCDNHYESCDCDRDIRHLSECENDNCDNDNICNDCESTCLEEFDENQDLGHNCQDSGNIMSNCESDCDCSCDCQDGKDGEIVSDPLNPDEVANWIQTNYPDNMNKTCGIHTHISFNDELSYMMIMKKDFYDKFVENLKSFAEKIGIPNKSESEFYRRLGNNEYYCVNRFKPHDQVHVFPTYEGDRYCFINYGYQTQRKTIEIRVLPCFNDRKYAILCVDEFVRFINDYLSKQKDPEVKEFTFDFEKLALNEVEK